MAVQEKTDYEKTDDLAASRISSISSVEELIEFIGFVHEQFDNIYALPDNLQTRQYFEGLAGYLDELTNSGQNELSYQDFAKALYAALRYE